MAAMEHKDPPSNIGALVALHGGPPGAAAKIGNKVLRQQFRLWVRRGYFSPFRINDIKPLLTRDITVAALYADLEANKGPRAVPGTTERRQGKKDRRKTPDRRKRGGARQGGGA